MDSEKGFCYQFSVFSDAWFLNFFKVFTFFGKLLPDVFALNFQFSGCMVSETIFCLKLFVRMQYFCSFCFKFSFFGCLWKSIETFEFVFFFIFFLLIAKKGNGFF